MPTLAQVLDTAIAGAPVPGAVALLARADDVEVGASGCVDAEGSAAMGRDTLFRIASVTKPVVAAALLSLVDDGTLALTDPVARWLPELAHPVVVRTPSSPVDDVVPAVRPVTVEHLLSSRAGWGYPSDFSLPVVALLTEELGPGSALPQDTLDPDAWVAALARVPLLDQPGATWLYNHCSDLQGVLLARVTGQPLEAVLAERVLAPLGMVDTSFTVPAEELHRFTSLYTPGEDGLALLDGPGGCWSRPPLFPSGSGGLVSTADDLLAFGRMVLGGGEVDGHRVLSEQSVRAMTTNHLSAAQRATAELFLEGQGWGFGGSVDVDRRDRWTVPGRYGWVGGSGTAWHVDPSRGTVAVLLTQVAMTDPTPPRVFRDFWTHVAAP